MHLPHPTNTTETPTEGDLRVWWIPQIPGEAFTVHTETMREALELTDVLAAYDLFQYEHNIKGDYANVGGVQRFEPDGDGGMDWFDVDEDFEREELYAALEAGAR